MGQLFLVIPNLRPTNFSEFFYLHSTVDSEFFQGGVWANFFINAKFDKKFFWNFLIYSVLWTLNFSQGGSGHQVSLVMLNLRSKVFHNFFMYRALWTLNFS